ncbi:MAG TPA: hypothetical protein VF234_10935, partial [Limnochordia bacterium]
MSERHPQHVSEGGRADRREEAPKPDPTTERLVLAFLDLIGERKLAGKTELAATQGTIAAWLSDRTGLAVRARAVQTLIHAMAEAGLITVGGGGIGRPNTYDTCEAAMGVEAFW